MLKRDCVGTRTTHRRRGASVQPTRMEPASLGLVELAGAQQVEDEICARVVADTPVAACSCVSTLQISVIVVAATDASILTSSATFPNRRGLMEVLRCSRK